MLKLELIFDKDCPNVDLARMNIREALKKLNLAESWDEYERHSDACPSYAKNVASPSIFIDGKDISDSTLKGELECCRLYQIDEKTNSLAPKVDMILNHLRN